jgi:hypothetical protein
VVESVFHATRETSKAAAERTREYSHKFADDFSPTVDTVIGIDIIVLVLYCTVVYYNILFNETLLFVNTPTIIPTDLCVCIVQISSATSSGWTTVSNAVRSGAAVAAETTSYAMDEIAATMNDGSQTVVRDAPVTTL